MPDTAASPVTPFDLDKPTARTDPSSRFPVRLALLALFAALGLMSVLVMGVAYLVGYRPNVHELLGPLQDASARLAGWWSEWSAASPAPMAAPDALAAGPVASDPSTLPSVGGACGPAEFASFAQETVKALDGVVGKAIAAGMLFLGGVAAVARASVVPAMMSIVNATFIIFAPSIILNTLGC